MRQLTLALSKGRIYDEALPILRKAGIVASGDPEASRKLTLATSDPNLRLIMVRAQDVPAYVQYGAAQLGIAGRDVLLEHGGEGLYQPLDLNIARCKMVVAARAGFDYVKAATTGARIKVATKYVKIAREHFAAKGVHADVIKLYGSMELAPLFGLADAIVDLSATGNTLKANNLMVVEEILPITSRLIVNQSALKLNGSALQRWIDAFRAAVGKSQ